jgi:hypothetical protein
MRQVFVFGLVATCAMTGCATATGGAEHGRLASASDPPSVRVRETRVVERGATEQGLAETSAHPARVVLDDSRFVVCWTTGTAGSGRRLMAQSLNASDGSARGAPVVVSPPGADVVGSARAETQDPRHVVATFVVSEGGALETRAVSLEAM